MRCWRLHTNVITDVSFVPVLGMLPREISQGEELDLQAWKEVVDRLYDKGVEVFSISGGEALLKDCLPQILEYIHIQSGKRNKYPGITLISNGRFMTNEYLRLFQRYHVNLAMSLPGYATFKDHTGVDNADGVLGWFRRRKD